MIHIPTCCIVPNVIRVPIWVDYGSADATSIDAGDFWYVDPRIRRRKHVLHEPVVVGGLRMIASLVSLSGPVLTHGQAIEYLADKMKMRPGLPFEMYAIGIEERDLQTLFPIIVADQGGDHPPSEKMLQCLHRKSDREHGYRRTLRLIPEWQPVGSQTRYLGFEPNPALASML